jgi:hypothetical protein
MKRRKQMMDDLDQDIRDHIESETQVNIERRCRRRKRVMRQCESLQCDADKEERVVWSFVWLEQLGQDIHYNPILEIPGFAAAILTLALGARANTAGNRSTYCCGPAGRRSFAVGPAKCARNAPNIHSYMTRLPHELGAGAAVPQAAVLRADVSQIAQKYLYNGSFTNSGGLNLTGTGATVIGGQLVRELLPYDGLKPPQILRSTRRTIPVAAPVAVLSYGYWQSAFGAAPDVVGHTRLKYPVLIGVAEQRFTGITQAAITMFGCRSPMRNVLAIPAIKTVRRCEQLVADDSQPAQTEHRLPRRKRR